MEDYIKKELEDAWSKMGDTGKDDYWETATKNEIFYYGHYRALEDVWEKINK